MLEEARKKIISALRDIGIRSGDTLLVHSDSTAVRQLTGLKWSDANRLLKDCLLTVLGESGCLLVPTFNWDFCQGKAYSHEKSRSQVGMFTNSILSDPGSLRSFHPIYSFAGIGPRAKEILDDVSNSSFGRDSVFHRLHTLNAKMLFFNVPFGVCTFVHYVEQMRGVDYRFLKQFTGEISRGNQTYVDSFDFYVRYLDKTVINHFDRLENYLLVNGKMDRLELDHTYPMLVTTCNAVFDAINLNLDRDPYYLLEHPPVPVDTATEEEA